MKKTFTLLTFLAGIFSFASAQLNVELQANLPYNYTLNDIWGHTTPDSVEYALVGTTEGLSIVSLKNPTQPVELQFIPGQHTVWRDIKTWGEFAYVVSDNTNEGMLIVDMSTLPADTARYEYWEGPVGELGMLRKSHNIYIDEFGLAYLAGSNLGSIIVLDVKEDPWNPKFILKTASPYAHDVYARDSVIYTSEIYEGEFGAYDFKDLDNVQYLGGALTPFRFTHNAWLSDDSKTIFTTDERANAYVASFDISDYDNIKELDRIRPAATEGEGVIPHNVHVYNDYLITSHYTDGVIIVDASRPDNLIQVGNYDTYTGANGGFSGAWGAYPFLPSGTTLVADRQNGLFVLKPNYVRGCYLEGIVLDSETNKPIFNAEIKISGDEIISSDFSDIAGEFKMGKAVPGTYTVTAELLEYNMGSVEAVFENGVQTDVVIYMVPKARASITGTVLSSSFAPGAVADANVIFINDDFTYQTTSNSEGIYLLSDMIEGSYKVYAGNWGEYVIKNIDVTVSGNEDLIIEPGYYDDFHFDYGWSVSGTSTGAHWVRDIPISETLMGFQCNPAVDIPEDIAYSAFMTGNTGGDAQDNSVEEGFTMLSSPRMDLSTMNEPIMRIRPWLCVSNTETQVYTMLISNGVDTVLIDTIRTSGNAGFWRLLNSFELRDLIEMTEDMRIHFKAENNTFGNVVKAALDEFVVIDGNPTSTKDVIGVSNFSIFPNPASGQFTIDLGDDLDGITPDQIVIINNLGQVVTALQWPVGQSVVTVNRALFPGVYFVQLTRDGNAGTTQKLVVQ